MNLKTIYNTVLQKLILTVNYLYFKYIVNKVYIATRYERLGNGKLSSALNQNRFTINYTNNVHNNEPNKQRAGTILDENWQALVKEKFGIDFQLYGLYKAQDYSIDTKLETKYTNKKNRTSRSVKSVKDIIADFYSDGGDETTPITEDEYVDYVFENASYIDYTHNVLLNILTSTKNGKVVSKIVEDNIIHSPLYANKLAIELAEYLNSISTVIYEDTKNKSDYAGRVALHNIVAYDKGFGATKVDIKKLELEDKNYNDDVLIAFRALLEELKNDTNGVVLLHGVAGSGKSTLLKILIGEVENRKIYNLSYSLCMSIFSNPLFEDFIVDLLREPAILIIEDAEHLIKPRDNASSSPALISLLQLTDGIATSGAAIILTYNRTEDVDKALVRKGRLLADIEVGELNEKKTAYLVEELNLPKEEVKSRMTLAELYNIPPITLTTTRKSVGFNS